MDPSMKWKCSGKVEKLHGCSSGMEVYGVDYGVQSFWCRLRDKCCHRKCPGMPYSTFSRSWSEMDFPFDNIVMSGGGSKGYAFVGALKALDDCGILGRVRKVAGSSVGAICAGLVGVGCSPQEIADVFALDVKWLFHDQRCKLFVCVPNLVRRFGIHPARRFYDIYGGHIERKMGNPDLTFKQLYDMTGRELCIVVTNLTEMVSEYCTYKTTPDLPIRLAVRMSMAFPVVYQPVQHAMGSTQCLYMDGGTLDQYPVHVFDNKDTGVDVNHNDEARNHRTLGLYVVSECPIDYKIWKTIFGVEIPYRPRYVPDTKLAQARLKDKHPTSARRKRLARKKTSKLKQGLRHITASLESIFKWPEEGSSQVQIRSFTDYLVAAIETLLVHQRRLTVKAADADRTVPINCGYIGTNDYEIEPADREFMIRQGYECTRQFLVDHVNKQNSLATELNQEPDSPSIEHHHIPNGHSTNDSTTRRQFQRCISIETQV